MSMKLTPIASIRIRASPGLGSGIGISSYFRTSGPPCSWTRTAFIIPPYLADCEKAICFVELFDSENPLLHAPRDAGEGLRAPVALVQFLMDCPTCERGFQSA